MTETLVTYHHPTNEFSLKLPENWDLVEDPQPGVALVALEPDRDGVFRCNLVVSVDVVPEGLDLGGWQAGAETMMREAMPDFLLIDLDEVEIGGRPAMYRLAHHLVPDQGAVTMAQWMFLRSGRGFTLTGSVGTMEYAYRADFFTDVATSVRFDGEDD
ncbi:DUF1795 domain-containing protein [Fodinicola acaciae]|uniref:DUF1795 domain-containing protein n=1 Tax=Fodinicola acaciae TaxID=2681555 RepID=UPI0013D2B9D1|nr:DUF1795 domain-containing protein [Fodinicola acaciae]